MPPKKPGLHFSLTAKIMVSLGALLTVLVLLLFVINLKSFSDLSLENAGLEADRLAETIKYGASHAMMANSREELQELVVKTSRVPQVAGVRIYNKFGQIMFSGDPAEVGGTADITGFECSICHQKSPPPFSLPLAGRMHVSGGDPDEDSPQRRLVVVSPILNEPGCSSESCHAHPADKNVLGLLTLSLSLDKQDAGILSLAERNSLSIAVALVGIFAVLTAVVYKLIHRPVAVMIAATRRIGSGDMSGRVEVDQQDELGELAEAISVMCREISVKHTELSAQRALYQRLFEGVPCIVTVQDRDFRLLRYNRAFSDKFQAREGAHCYQAYKGRSEKCPHCPVERTFNDGLSHFTEESGVYKDGTTAHWIVTTSPIFDEDGHVVAAMEMCLDITTRKQLDEELRKSERKYLEIFNSIPNAVFVLDAETLEILECNKGVGTLFGFRKGEIIGRGISMLFPPEEAEACTRVLLEARPLTRVKNVARDGRIFYVNINIARSEFHERRVLLATVVDVTERIKAEQQLIQASKMATLGEMATGVAHELNQPLSVMQMVANLFLRKLEAGETPDDETLRTMAQKLKNNVERSTKIINHMRDFGRKPAALASESVDLNQVLRRSYDFFSQQLKLRDVTVVWDLDGNLPAIQADPNRLEQVFVNLLINARDAIAAKCDGSDCGPTDKIIALRTKARRRNVIAEVVDTGVGIPKDLQGRLFEPFFTTKQVGKGTGLGLSISYGIVQDYGGSIHVRSQPGLGARFIVAFPRRDRIADRGAEEPREAGQGEEKGGA